MNNFELKPHAQECLELLPRWREKAEKGDYSDHEIKVMLMCGVNPSSPLYRGISEYRENTNLIERSKIIYKKVKIERKEKEEERQAFLNAPKLTEEEISENKKRIAKTIGNIFNMFNKGE